MTVSPTAQGWGSDGFRPSNVGRASGPSVLYEDPTEMALAVCPLTHFHAAVQHYNGTAGTWGCGSRRRDCHSAAPPSTYSRCFNRDGERAPAK